MAQREPRLVRIREDRMIGGVTTGLAQKFDIDVTLVRLAFVALAFANGLGVLVYLVLWIVMPDEEGAGGDARASVRANVEDIAGQAQRAGQQIGDSLRGSSGSSQGRVVIGLGLMALGILFATRQLGFVLLPAGLNVGRVFWPLALIGVGVILLGRRTRRE